MNQETYDRLKLLLSLNMRRQILLAVCDDLVLRDRLVTQLESELAYPLPSDIEGDRLHDYPHLVSLTLDLHDPNPVVQMAQWLTEFPPPVGQDYRLPAFQIIGIEHLTRQPAAVQRLFFSYLDGIERSLPMMEFSVLVWLPRPWFNALKESAPDFWRCRNAVFEFVGDPTPLTHPSHPSEASTATTSNPSPQLPASSPQPKPEAPAAQFSERELLKILHHDLRSLDRERRSPSANQSQSTTTDDPPKALTPPPLLPLTTQTSHSSTNGPSPAIAHGMNGKSLGTSYSISAKNGGSITLNSLKNVPSDRTQAFIPPAAPPDLDLDAVTDPKVLKEQIALLHQQQASPSVLSNAYRTLGNLYRTRVEEGAAADADILAAIQAYEQVLVWLQESSPVWIDVLNDMGNLFWMLSRRSPDPEKALFNLNQAIATYQHGLARVKLPEHLPNYTMLQNNLGAAYSDLARFENPPESLQKSIQAYQQALRHRNPDLDPLRYALTQNNLGTAYWNLAQHYKPKDNLKQAVAAYSEALRFYRPETEPLNHAMIQNNLGTAYWNLAQHERPQDWLTLALGAYRMALRYRTIDKTPAAYAATQNNLGTAYWHMANHCKNNPEARLDYLRQAIVAYAETLIAVERIVMQHRWDGNTSPTLNFDVYATHNNLALAHYQLATDYQIPFQDDIRLDHLDLALREHLKALQGWMDKTDLHQTTVGCIARTVRAFYNQGGIKAQNQALSKIPANLLPEILPQL